jgi:hypothetical protein
MEESGGGGYPKREVRWTSVAGDIAGVFERAGDPVEHHHEVLDNEVLARQYRAAELAEVRASVARTPWAMRWAAWIIYWVWREATRMHWE